MTALNHIRPYDLTRYKLVVDKVFSLLLDTEVLVIEFSFEKNEIGAVLCEHVCSVIKSMHDPQVRPVR